jgi:hypothetical protein
MPNPHPPCQICRRRHRAGNCGAKGGMTPPRPAQGNQWDSLPGIVADFARLFGELATLVEKLPCVARMREEKGKG